MPIGYLETIAPIALLTLAVLVPPRRPYVLARIVFVLTHPLNEAPVIGWGWLLASTGFAFADGQLESTGGIVVLSMAVLVAAGLTQVTRRGLRARRAVEHALRQAPGFRPSTPEGRGKRLRLVRAVCFPLPLRPRRVRRIRNVRYGPHGGQNMLDLYVSRDKHAGPRPVLIHFHGGHFDIGAKSREALPLLHRFAANGWLCVSANYRLRSAGRFPNMLIDAKTVISWVRSSAATAYEADPSMVIVAGSSAGAHLAAMAALTINEPVFQPGFEDADTTVTGAVCLYGYYGELGTTESQPSSPRAYMRRDAPPFFIAHGNNDTLLPIRDCDQFVDELRRASANRVAYIRLPHTLHSFDLLLSPRFSSVLDGVEDFTAALTPSDVITQSTDTS